MELNPFRWLEWGSPEGKSRIKGISENVVLLVPSPVTGPMVIAEEGNPFSGALDHIPPSDEWGLQGLTSRIMPRTNFNDLQTRTGAPGSRRILCGDNLGEQTPQSGPLWRGRKIDECRYTNQSGSVR